MPPEQGRGVPKDELSPVRNALLSMRARAADPADTVAGTQPDRPIRPSATQAWAMVTVWAAVPVTAWWAIGDQSEVGGYLYMLKPPVELSPAAEAVAGAASLAACAMALGVLAVTGRARPLAAGWWVVIALNAAAGVVVAAMWRIITSAAGGAHFGGLVLGPGLPLVFALVGIAGAKASSLLRSSRTK